MPRHDSRSLFRPAPYIPIPPISSSSLLQSFTCFSFTSSLLHPDSRTVERYQEVATRHEQIHRRQVLHIAAAILTGNRDIGSPEMAICSDHWPNHESSTCNIDHRGTTETGRANRIYPQLFDDAQVWGIYTTSKHRFTSDLFTVASALELSGCNPGSL